MDCYRSCKFFKKIGDVKPFDLLGLPLPELEIKKIKLKFFTMFVVIEVLN